MPQNNVVVCARSDYEEVTHYGAYWLSFAVDDARRRGLLIEDLLGPEATADNFRIAITTLDPALVYGMGHGNSNVFTLQNQEYALVACTNDQLLAGRVVYLLSCVTGAGLGPSAVGKGCLAYMGYDQDFSFIIEDPYNPASDRYTNGGFRQGGIEPILSLQAGKTAGEAFERTLAVFNQWIDYWSKSSDSQASLCVANLAHDRDCLVLVGEGQTKASTPRLFASMPLIAFSGLPMLFGAGIVIASQGIGRKAR